MKHRFSDLFDHDFLQMMVDYYHDITGIAIGIMDTDGILLADSGCQDICTHFHLSCQRSKQRCLINSQYLQEHFCDDPYTSYQCPNGLIHYAAPIYLQDDVIGTAFTGQILHEPPDLNRFIEQAREFGFNTEAYLQALAHVPIISPEELSKSLLLFVNLSSMLVYMGSERQQRLKAEHDNQTSEAHLQLIMEASNDGFWEWSKTEPFFINARCIEILGFTPENFVPLPHIWLERIHPQDVERVKQMFQDHIHGNTPYFSSEYRFCSGSGDWIWIQAKARMLMSKAGQPLRIAGSVSDITTRKNTELILQESESLYRSLVETSPSGIVLTDVNGIILFINRQGAEMSGWNDYNQLLGKSARILFSPQDWEGISRDYLRVMTFGELNNLEYTCICRNGTQFIIDLSAAPIYDAANQLRGCLTIAQDITQRKQMERELLQHRIHLQKLVEEHTVALRLSEEKFTKAFRANPTSMSISTLEEGTYIDVNDAFCDMVGYKKGELIGQPSVKIWAKPNDRVLFKKKIDAHGYIKDFELYFYSRSGEVRIGLLSGQRIQIGSSIYILSSIIDVTEQRMMDREIARLDRLNLIGEMAASIGHEIRNPMTTVRGLLQILGQDDAYQKDRELFDLMIEELDRSNSIISEFLSLAKDKIVELLPRNLSAAATSVIPLIQANATAQDKKLSVYFSTVPDILLDEKEIRQLLLNLSQNGLEAMETGGTLTLKIYEEEDKVVLAVQDQGKGVDPHIMDKLGMPFVTTKDQGTGLGLSVCYRIAARHNANIQVESNPQGSIFYVYFPIK